MRFQPDRAEGVNLISRHEPGRVWVQASAHVGALVVLAAALNGIAVMHAYFRIFTGTEHTASISLASRMPERVAVWILSALILGGGLYPQPGVKSRYHAATEIISRRPGHPYPVSEKATDQGSVKHRVPHER